MAGSCAMDFQTQSVLALNKNLKVPIHFWFFILCQHTFDLKVDCTSSGPYLGTYYKSYLYYLGCTYKNTYIHNENIYSYTFIYVILKLSRNHGIIFLLFEI